jgi:hypothetical protein
MAHLARPLAAGVTLDGPRTDADADTAGRGRDPDALTTRQPACGHDKQPTRPNRTRAANQPQKDTTQPPKPVPDVGRRRTKHPAQRVPRPGGAVPACPCPGLAK